jgi:hypothetical protein
MKSKPKKIKVQELDNDSYQEYLMKKLKKK